LSTHGAWGIVCRRCSLATGATFTLRPGLHQLRRWRNGCRVILGHRRSSNRRSWGGQLALRRFTTLPRCQALVVSSRGCTSIQPSQVSLYNLPSAKRWTVSDENFCRISALRRSIRSRRLWLMFLVSSEKKRIICPHFQFVH
jgi:hypothetical protein